MKLIDADKLLELMTDPMFKEWFRETMKKIIKNTPTVDAVPVVHGEWKLYGNDDDSGMSYWCTACNFQLSEDLFYSGYKNGRWIENGVFKYCPNCGAKMEER